MHISRVESNIKGGVAVDLAPLTLVVGPSGSAKTSIWNAIELVFTGTVSDVGVYDARSRERDLLDDLAPPDADKLWSKVVVTAKDGTTQDCTVSIARNTQTGGAKKAERDVPVNVLLPVHAFRDGLRGSGATVRAFLLALMTADLTDADVIERIDASSRPAFKALRDSVYTPTSRPVELLLEVRDKVKSRASKVGKKATDALSASNAWSQGLDPAPTKADIEKLTADYDAATARLKQAKSAIMPDVDGLRAAAIKAVESYKKADAAVSELAAKVHDRRDGPVTPPNIAKTRDAVIHVMDVHVHQDLSSCVVCGTAFTAMQRDKLKESHTILINAANKDNGAANDVERLRIMTSDRAFLKKQALTHVTALKEAEKAVEASTGANTTIDPDEALTDVTVAQTALLQAKQLIEKWEQVNAKKAEAAEYVDEKKNWIDLLTSCDAAVADLMESARKDYIERVNKALPPDDTFDLILSETRGGKTVDVCKFGLVIDGHLRTAISGAELGRVVAAMTAATINTTNQDLVVVTLPRDVAMDRHALRSTMTALSVLAVEGVQVILFSVITHAGKRPAGWANVTIAQDGSCKISQ